MSGKIIYLNRAAKAAEKMRQIVSRIKPASKESRLRCILIVFGSTFILTILATASITSWIINRNHINTVHLQAYQYQLSSECADHPYFGQITYPFELQHFVNHDELVVEGVTQNIPEGRYLWICLDDPSNFCCHPCRPYLKSNTHFKTRIALTDAQQHQIISLYAVDKTTHDDILNYLFTREHSYRYDGFPLIASKFRLDSVRLKIKRV